MQAVLRKDALTETHLDMQNLIYKIVWRFKNRYGGEFEQLLAQANLLFVLAYDSHNKNKAGFSTWIHHCLITGLLDFKKLINQENKYTRILQFSTINHLQESSYQQSYFFELLDELGEDSKQIIKLILNPPAELMEIIFEKDKYNPRTFKAELGFYLFSLGWTGRRIKESFNEIREVINNND